MADEQTMPTLTEQDLRSSGLPSTMEMSPGLAIFFNDALYSRCKQIAAHMAKAEGMMPRHLIGKPEACFAVVSRAIVWKLDPFSVAMATYQTPGGSIGYMGVLIQAIIENSGKLDGGVNYEMRGDWAKVKGKFRLQDGKNGGKFPVPTWGPEDAKGLSVIVSALVKGEADRRTLEFDLIEAFPLNSPLWATAPQRQIKYTACRAFGNQAVPSLLMGVPFDVDPTGFYGDPMIDVTPARPTKNAFEREAKSAKTTEKPPVTEVTETEPVRDTQPSQQSTVPAAEVRQDAQQEPEREPQPEPQQQAQPEPEPVRAEQEQQAVELTSDDGNALTEEVHEWYEAQKANLEGLKKIRDVAEIRDAIMEQLEGDQAKEWERLCDARTKAILAATSKPKAR